MKLEAAGVDVEAGGYIYACHRTPSGAIVCGHCGVGRVKDGACNHCGARQMRTPEPKPTP